MELPLGNDFDDILIKPDEVGNLVPWKRKRKVKRDLGAEKGVFPNGRNPRAADQAGSSRFWQNYRPKKIAIPITLIFHLQEQGIKSQLYEHAAILVYVFQKWKRCQFDPVGIPVWHGEWPRLLRVSESRAKTAERDMRKRRLLGAYVKVDLGAPCNRYVVSRTVAELIDPSLEQAGATMIFSGSCPAPHPSLLNGYS